MPTVLEAHNLVVKRGGRPVLEIEHLSIAEGEVLAVIGPNGAGKSTLLLALGRLLRPESGQILFRGQPLGLRDELAYRRRIGLVLQNPLLLDASVFDNVATGLRFRGLAGAEIIRRVDEWLSRLGVSHLRNRPARQLSGGEAQRVSLARAFAVHPDLLLLDEPFGALDAPTRASLLEDFQALLAATSMTAMFVTHNLDEALWLGDRLAVILEGRLRQYGPPEQVFSAPADPDVAAFVGVDTVVAGEVVAAQNGLVTVMADGLRLEAIGGAGANAVARGRAVLLCLRPEDVTLWSGNTVPASSARNRLSGHIERMVPQGPVVRVVVDCGLTVVAMITRASARQMGLTVGEGVTVTFKASAVHLIPR